MSLYNVPENQSLNESIDVPIQVVPESMKRLIKSSVQTTSITPSNSNTATQNQSLRFDLPSGFNAPWLVSQSIALECDVEIVKTTATNGFKYKFPTQSAHALINGLNISCGGQTIDDIPRDYRRAKAPKRGKIP